jgi:O-antigen/teichoic acid export membrane protein
MPKTHADYKNATQILLAEYNSLRSEINARVSNAFQVVAIASTAAVAWVFTSSKADPLLIKIAAPAFIVIILICIWFTFRDFYKAGLRVRELEAAINKLAKKKLLVWETELGGLAIGTLRLRLVLWLLWIKEPFKP